MAKKSASSKSNKNHDKNLRALTALMVLCVGFGVFLIFTVYKDNIMDPSKLQPFIILSVLLGAFLIGLLYLLNPKR